jgi:hypothetical protein
MPKISVDEFARRLEAQCLSRGGRGLPRKQRDKHVLYRSIVSAFEPGKEYAEKELNGILEKWLSEVGKEIEVDHVSLRRHLVDEGYLTRDPAGRAYKIQTEWMANLFEPETDGIDPVAVIAEALKRREEKRRMYRNPAGGKELKKSDGQST